MQLIDFQNIAKGAIIIGVYRRSHQSAPPAPAQTPLRLHHPTQQECELDLDELAALLHTLGIPTVHRVLQCRHRSHGSYFIGKGKLEELRELAKASCTGLLAVDSSLTGSQLRTMERLTGCQVIDREGIILEIFANHAQTSVARLQVEMARWQYLMPRLVGAWTHFSRQKGGVHSKGMGEKQIEIDRRIGRTKIAGLKKKLAQIEVGSHEQRKRRQHQLKAALVGYTNSGKTTLMHGLTSLSTTGQDQLFATLSAKVKASSPLGWPHILFTDTVGFIGRLPHNLVASFKSTFAETLAADLLIHVVDVSHPRYADQLTTSERVLAEMGVGTQQMIHVFNKVDRLEQPSLLKQTLKKHYPHSYWMSALNPDDITKLGSGIRDYFLARLDSARLQVPLTHHHLIAQIYRLCIVTKCCYATPGVVTFLAKGSVASFKKMEPQIIEAGGELILHLNITPPPLSGPLSQNKSSHVPHPQGVMNATLPHQKASPHPAPHQDVVVI